MLVDRRAFIVYYQGKDIIKKIEKMPINIAYISKKASYMIFYGDKLQEKNYYNQIKNSKGFKKFETSQLYNEESFFDVK